MNCFDWQNRSADYLDGSMIGPLKRDADEHLDSCANCNEKHQHYRRILTSISSQARIALPIPIRKSPLSFILPRLDAIGTSSSRWDRTPWFIRTSVEGLGVAFLILGVIAMVPRYEASMSAVLNEGSMSSA